MNSSIKLTEIASLREEMQEEIGHLRELEKTFETAQIAGADVTGTLTVVRNQRENLEERMQAIMTILDHTMNSVLDELKDAICAEMAAKDASGDHQNDQLESQNKERIKKAEKELDTVIDNVLEELRNATGSIRIPDKSREDTQEEEDHGENQGGTQEEEDHGENQGGTQEEEDHGENQGGTQEEEDHGEEQKDTQGEITALPNKISQTCYLELDLIPWRNFVGSSDLSVNDNFYRYFDSVFNQLRIAGVGQINLGFAQICNIASIGGRDSCTRDPFSACFNQYPEHLKLMLEKGRLEYGMSFNLSFGGDNSLLEDYNIPEGLAMDYGSRLLDLLPALGISGVDISVNPSVFKGTRRLSELRKFFSTLRSSFGTSRPMTLSTRVSISEGPDSTTSPLFYDTTGSCIFESLFNGLNLIAHSQDSKYYIYASNPVEEVSPGWALQEWIDLAGSPEMINLGFSDAVPYQDPASWARPFSNMGFPFRVPENATMGQSARAIYEQVQAQLGTSLGTPFWSLDASSGRYQPQPDGAVDFRTKVLRDFAEGQ